jgi:hypothetical protein
LQKIDIRRLFRDKVAIFLHICIPFNILILFSVVYSVVKVTYLFNVALINNSKSDFANSFVKQVDENDVFKVKADIKNVDDAKERMNRGELDATIILPEDFGVVHSGKLHPTGQAEVFIRSKQSTGLVRHWRPFLDGVFRGINAKFVSTEMPFNVKTTSTATAGFASI